MEDTNVSKIKIMIGLSNFHSLQSLRDDINDKDAVY